MSSLGLLLVIVGIFVIYEASRSLGPAIAEAEAQGSGGPSSVGGAPGTPATSIPGGTDVEHNVRTLANWAKQNGIDPRVALTILAGESGGQSNPASSDPANAGPLQINYSAHGGSLAVWSKIENDIGVVASQWISTLRGVSYQQFLGNPTGYFSAAQGAVPAVVQRNLAASGNYQATVASWCQQYGVC